MLNQADRDVLLAEAARLSALRVETLLADQPRRVDEMTLSAAGLTLDYSKQLVDDKALTALTAAGASSDWGECHSHSSHGGYRAPSHACTHAVPKHLIARYID